MQIIKVPGLNALGKTTGCRNAGNEIINQLQHIYSSETNKIIDKNLLDLEEIHVDNNNLNEQDKLISKNSLNAFEIQNKVIFLGGDHSVSYSIGKAFLEYCKKNNQEPCLIIFDAHPDCMRPLKEPTHEEWLRAIIEKDNFPVQNILLIGTRNKYKDEIEFLSKNKVKQISINQINENLQEISDIITEFAYKKTAYVSVDIDVVDPIFAPSTNFPEPGGLTSRQIIYIIQRLNLIKDLKAVDIVEIDVEKDKDNNFVTTKLAAKLLSELL